MLGLGALVCSRTAIVSVTAPARANVMVSGSGVAGYRSWLMLRSTSALSCGSNPSDTEVFAGIRSDRPPPALELDELPPAEDVPAPGVGRLEVVPVVDGPDDAGPELLGTAEDRPATGGVPCGPDTDADAEAPSEPVSGLVTLAEPVGEAVRNPCRALQEADA